MLIFDFFFDMGLIKNKKLWFQRRKGDKNFKINIVNGRSVRQLNPKQALFIILPLKLPYRNMRV